MPHIFPDLLRTAAAFVVVLGVLVFFHELGHYLAARWRGVHVEVFSVGFGRTIASWYDKRGTQWRISWLPLGGFVRMHGQERPEDVSDEVRASWKPGQTFHEKPVGSRAIIVAAGPIANFVLAMVLFAAGAMYCWGDNLNGQLGDGTTTNHFSPRPVSAFTSLSRARAQLPTARLGRGAHPITANYHGEARHTPSADTQTHTVQ